MEEVFAYAILYMLALVGLAFIYYCVCVEPKRIRDEEKRMEEMKKKDPEIEWMWDC